MLAAMVLAATATLIVPYFEVSIEPENRNFDTRFTIANSSDAEQRARINVWTDHGRPVLYYTTLIEPHGSKTISMREILVDGSADICASPGEGIPSSLLQAVRCTLTTGCEMDLTSPDYDCRNKIGERHAHAIGYVTIDAVSDCADLTSPSLAEYSAQIRFDAVFTGSFEQIANGSVLSSGALMDRMGGPVPQFDKPKTPRDPQAQQPPKKCAPIDVPSPQS